MSCCARRDESRDACSAFAASRREVAEPWARTWRVSSFACSA